MKKLLLFVLCPLVLAPLTLVRAQDLPKPEFPGVEKAMKPDDYEAAGLSKLSEEERARLDEFIRDYVLSSNERVAEKAATEAVDRAVKEKKIKLAEPEVIQSRIVGPYSGYKGQTRFLLENGQTWVQSQRVSMYFPKVESPQVVLVKGTLGWRMYIAGGGDIRVQKVK